MKISSLTIDERVSGPLLPLPPLLPDCYFSCSRAESQFSPFANLLLCIIKHHMWSTVESRIAFWYFLWPGLCTNVSAHFGDRNPTGVARRGEQWPQSLVLTLGCDLRRATAVALHSADRTCRDQAGAPQVSTFVHQISWLTPPWHDSLNPKTRGASEAKCTSFPFFPLYLFRL